MASLTAEALQRVYGQELAGEPYVSLTSTRYLFKALRARAPPLAVTEAVCKQWFQKYRTPVGAVRVETVEELGAGYGPLVRHLQMDAGGSAYKLLWSAEEAGPRIVYHGRYCQGMVAAGWCCLLYTSPSPRDRG